MTVTFIIVIVLSLIGTTFNETAQHKNNDPITIEDSYNLAPPSLKVFYSLEKHEKISGIPTSQIYRYLKLETGYKGVAHLNYKSNQISTADAAGPYQVRAIAARQVWGKELKHMTNKAIVDSLLTDIDFCTITAFKYMKYLKGLYGANYVKIASAYNQGPANANNTNDYARSINK